MWEIKEAETKDLHSWMKLVDKEKWNFPGLDSEEGLLAYKNTVVKNINRKTALCAKDDEKVIGILIYSIKQKILSCMLVDHDYRNKGIASSLITTMLGSFSEGDEIKVSTFRENDPKGIAPRMLYRKLGFIEGELCEEFNYPHQIFKKKM